MVKRILKYIKSIFYKKTSPIPELEERQQMQQRIERLSKSSIRFYLPYSSKDWSSNTFD